jgi:phage-related protein
MCCCNAFAAVAGAVISKLGDAVAWVQSVWPQISEAVGHVMVAVQEVVERVLLVVMAIWHTVGDDIFNVVDRIFHAIYGVINGVLDALRGLIQTMLAVINGDWGRAWDGFLSFLRGIWDAVYAVIAGAFGIVKSLFGGLGGLILQALGNLGGILVNAGKEIVQGLIDGIGSMGGALARFVGEFIKRNTVDKVKDVLGIRSPSTVFAELGRYTMEGFNVGVGETAVSMIPFPAIASASGLAAAAAGGAAAGAAVDVRVFLGDRELTDIVRTEVRGRDGELIDALRAGTGRVNR